MAQPRTRLEIAGTAANLALLSAPETNPWAAQLQIGRLDLYESRAGNAIWRSAALKVDDDSTLPIEAANVGRLYNHLAADLRRNTHKTPNFATARELHALIEQIPQPPR